MIAVRLDVRDDGGGGKNMLVSNLWVWVVGGAMCQGKKQRDVAGLWGDVSGKLNLWDIPVETWLEFRTKVWAGDRFAAISMLWWLRP